MIEYPDDLLLVRNITCTPARVRIPCSGDELCLSKMEYMYFKFTNHSLRCTWATMKYDRLLTKKYEV